MAEDSEGTQGLNPFQRMFQRWDQSKPDYENKPGDPGIDVSQYFPKTLSEQFQPNEDYIRLLQEMTEQERLHTEVCRLAHWEKQLGERLENLGIERKFLLEGVDIRDRIGVIGRAAGVVIYNRKLLDESGLSPLLLFNYLPFNKAEDLFSKSSDNRDSLIFFPVRRLIESQSSASIAVYRIVDPAFNTIVTEFKAKNPDQKNIGEITHFFVDEHGVGKKVILIDGRIEAEGEIVLTTESKGRDGLTTKTNYYVLDMTLDDIEIMSNGLVVVHKALTTTDPDKL